MTLKRIQLRRTKGWRMPHNTVNVARPRTWGNPYHVGRDGDAVECVRKFRHHVEVLATTLAGQLNLAEIRGKNLACWCKLGDPCHADVLLELANRP